MFGFSVKAPWRYDLSLIILKIWVSGPLLFLVWTLNREPPPHTHTLVLGSISSYKLRVRKQSLAWILDHHSYPNQKCRPYQYSARSRDWVGQGHLMCECHLRCLISSWLHHVYQRACDVTPPSLLATPFSPRMPSPPAHHSPLFPVSPLIFYFFFLLSFLAGKCQFSWSMSFFQSDIDLALFLSLFTDEHSNL